MRVNKDLAKRLDEIKEKATSALIINARISRLPLYKFAFASITLDGERWRADFYDYTEPLRTVSVVRPTDNFVGYRFCYTAKDRNEVCRGKLRTADHVYKLNRNSVWKQI